MEQLCNILEQIVYFILFIVGSILFTIVYSTSKIIVVFKTIKGFPMKFKNELRIIYNWLFYWLFKKLNPVTDKRININIDNLKMTKINGKYKLQFELFIYNYNYEPIFIDNVQIIANITGEIGKENIEIKDNVNPLEIYKYSKLCYIVIDESILYHFKNNVVQSTYEVFNKYSIMPIMFEIYTNVETNKKIYDKYKATKHLHPELYNLKEEYNRYNMLYKEN